MNLVKRNGNSNGLFPSVMDELFKDWMGGTQVMHRMVPPVNIRENEDSYLVELMAPGMKKEDFNIELDNDLLTISSEIKHENNHENGKYTKREFMYSSFRRSFTLPETVKEEDINASYQDGILKITLPKKEEALPKPKRLIEIA
ncbi:molecular chaperone Hsp20 [Flavobacterium cyanobacteriorum]|uniref:Molecular chaperone Hsp20 n=1 Tax=Flavobacterium cyanobacteriorum TaxID=2022802 RepID=A0A255ZR96_9FLAO|nr:Hsp20/alpha crystallin family protein [Flavobacterium cyanobacteriorum]OYQ43405.1 molecular chaperone Hsp20 [Flavobacterium cyanobacteriorum]